MSFEELGLRPEVLQAVKHLGYENATPVQAQTIPALSEGRDIIGQAQTGTGKTAAFALPILSKIDIKLLKTQALILAPTRELAIQVAEAFQSYAKFLPGFHVLPIYGGQDYRPQLKALERGVQVVVGTPGRVMDHLERKTLSLAHVKIIVLDEADEMLNMGFLEDVEWILSQMPAKHQTALFSATMPTSIKNIAKKYLKEAEHIKIQATEASIQSIKQYYVRTHRDQKLEVLTRILEVENFEAAIIFTRTKVASSEVAEKLEARGYSAAAINGDMAQALREKVIRRLKQGSLDIIVATEVAARGLDIDRISFVINYDMPYDVESYVHRIGRTGRAGREGKALVLITPREFNLLKDIERTTHQKMEELKPPSVAQIKEKRLENLAAKITEAMTNKDSQSYRPFLQNLAQSAEKSELDIACALLHLMEKKESKPEMEEIREVAPRFQDRDRGDRPPRSAPRGKTGGVREAEAGMTRCRMALGRQQGVTPADIVGLIANKAGVNRKAIGQIHIFEDYTWVDIAEPVVKDVIRAVQKCKLKRQMTEIAVL